MTYFIEAMETDVRLPFPSEDAFEAAQDWYNATPKKDQIRFCLSRGVDLSLDEDTLLEGWAEVSMMVKAWEECAIARDMIHAMVKAVREAQ